MIRSFFSALLGAIGTIVMAVLSAVIKFINRFVPWHKLPTPIAVFNLLIFRNDLRKHNLHDTAKLDGFEQVGPKTKMDPKYRYSRAPDGSFTDPSDPRMGCSNTRFARNFPAEHCWPDEGEELMAPNPREVANKLMTRDTFKPATTLNIIAAAWIQFQNHEWFNHQRSKDQHIEIEIPEGDDWDEKTMRIERTLIDPSRDPKDRQAPPTYLSEETHWWDGSQLYGSSGEKEAAVRSGKDGKLKVETLNGEIRLPADPSKMMSGVDLTGFNQNYWVGLSLLHTLFAREHNAICDALKAQYPGWDDERLFLTARLINGGLMAKIHTVEWTPGILGHPALQIAMAANWWGLIGERLTKIMGRFSNSEAISGIPGSPADHHGAPYFLTEEFTAVYRLHPLIPDDYTIRSHRNGQQLGKVKFGDIQGNNTRASVDKYGMADLMYSLGVENAGAVVLRNFPDALRNFQRPDGVKLDLATLDIMRDRERGVPRYNKFRQLLRMPRIKKFEDLTPDKKLAEEIRTLYNGDIDKVDLMVGMYAEEPPAGFGFSDTAFRIFILMASRRLKSDRFFTEDFRPEVYTPLGIRWVQENGMNDVLQRHFPELTPAFQNAANPFAPWQRVDE